MIGPDLKWLKNVSRYCFQLVENHLQFMDMIIQKFKSKYLELIFFLARSSIFYFLFFVFVLKYLPNVVEEVLV